MTKAKKGRVVEAAMSAGAGAAIGGATLAHDIEAAMSAATMKALEDGITDPAKIIKLKLAARDQVVKDAKAAQ